MKLIEQKAELLIQPKGIYGLEQQIEIAARTCYKSENKITEDSAKEMMGKLVTSKHLSMLEHGTVYLKFDQSKVPDTMVSKYYLNPYSKAKFKDESGMAYITTNYRVLYEHGWTKDLKYWCEPTDNHVKRYTFRLTTSIGIVRELLRHRVFSFANESTRYVNYNKKDEFCFIKPYWYDECDFVLQNRFDYICNAAIGAYNFVLQHKYPPQAAREVLPLCTKSELIMTGFEDDWNNFLDVRLKGTTGKPHPDMVVLAQMIQDELNKVNNYEKV